MRWNWFSKNQNYKQSNNHYFVAILRSSPSEVFFEKVVLKICSKFTAEHSCRGVISINLLSKFIEIELRHGCFSVNLLHIFRTDLRTPLDGCFCILVPIQKQPTEVLCRKGDLKKFTKFI